MINDFLKLGKNIGKGAFSKVKRAVGTFIDDNDESVDEVYAVKVYNKVDLKKHITSFYNQEGLLQMKTQLDQIYNEIRVWE